MDSWSNLCRCCLSPESYVSLLNYDEHVNEQFLETTSIEVKQDDGLPHNLCNNCYSLMISAYEFRLQCTKVDKELKLQLETTTLDQKQIENCSQIETQVKSTSNMTIEDIAKESMKQLESLIKQEPNDDSDDEFYYVVVVDEPEDATNEDAETNNGIAIESNTQDVDNFQEGNMEVDDENNFMQYQNKTHSTQFENNIESFLVSNPKVPMNVPATILENEEGQDINDNFDNIIMDVNEVSQPSQEQNLSIIEETDSQYSIAGDIVNNLSNKNYIKILTPSGAERTILLKGEDGIKYVTDPHMLKMDEDSAPEEVIFYEGDESDLQILKCDASELIIEYADDSHIATVIQQDDGTFLCECGEQFDDLGQYQNHQLKHTQTEEFLCNLCGKGFETCEILAGHMILHSTTGFFVTCPFCDQDVKRNTLTQHIKYTHNSKPQCNLCKKTFANQNNLKRHMMIHSGIKDFECDICQKRFHQKITMQTHRLTHVNPFTCYQCGIKFESKLALATHKGTEDCQKLRKSKVKEELMKTVKQEILTNAGKLLGFACSLCKKMFSVESALDQHVENKHLLDSDDGSGEGKFKKNLKRFDCLICGKGCASQAMLIMHERVHTNERPFPCQLCSLRFKTRTHLRTHQLTHTREKKFGCSVCMKFFALKGNLVVHLRTHTGERPYVCTICGEAYIDSKYLKKHKQKKHAIENVPWNKYE
ncbi:zinc finger and SCAN domain-containing protein 2-like isoform X1 [Pararge aegeria]|nr:zinc finger and SCAN domain-containing protein 2-like isoform X1 [Pararge aegeria]XP_039745973.1 zinc finger and SCAN domain-containing protein 2-like isoform X1 [Pararge aegeria]